MAVYSSQGRRTRLARCWLDGVEVSKDCFYADPRRGVVRVYLKLEGGRFFVKSIGNTQEVAWQEKRGKVKVKLKSRK